MNVARLLAASSPPIFLAAIFLAKPPSIPPTPPEAPGLLSLSPALVSCATCSADFTVSMVNVVWIGVPSILPPSEVILPSACFIIG